MYQPEAQPGERSGRLSPTPRSSSEPINRSELVRPIPIVYILAERCKECSYCLTFCPKGILELSDERNARGYRHPRVKEGRENDCTGCDICTWLCPDFAIYTLRVVSTP